MRSRSVEASGTATGAAILILSSANAKPTFELKVRATVSNGAVLSIPAKSPEKPGSGDAAQLNDPTGVLLLKREIVVASAMVPEARRANP